MPSSSRTRDTGVDGVPTTIEAEAVDVLRRSAASQFRRFLEDGHVHAGSGKIASDGQSRHPATNNHGVRSRMLGPHLRCSPSSPQAGAHTTNDAASPFARDIASASPQWRTAPKVGYP